MILIFVILSLGALNADSRESTDMLMNPNQSFNVELTFSQQGLPVVAARIGEYNGQFLIDTGAAVSVVDRDFARKVGIRAYGLPTIVRFSGGIRIQRFVRLSRALWIGNASFSNIQWVRSDFSRREAFYDYDGIIGRDVLRKVLVVIDGPHLRGALVDRKTFNERYTQPFNGFYSMPMSTNARISIEISDMELKLLVDTGAVDAITLFRSPGGMIPVGQSAFVTLNMLGRPRRSSVGIIPSIGFGPVAIDNVAVAVSPDRLPFRGKDGIIGNRLLHQGKWIIDLEDGTLWFQFNPESRFDQYLASAMSVVTYYDGPRPERSVNLRFVVVDINKRNPLSLELDIRAGDEIVSIDGIALIQIDAPQFTNHAAVEKLLWYDFDTVAIRRDGTLQEIQTVRNYDETSRFSE